MSLTQAMRAIRARWPRLQVTISDGIGCVVIEGNGWHGQVRPGFGCECDGIPDALGWEAHAQIRITGPLADVRAHTNEWATDPCDALASAMAHVVKATRAAVEVAAEMVTATDGGGA